MQLRENLVLVHSFPTNSVLLEGFSEFLAPHFAVHWVDLPGFTSAEPPSRNATLESFASHFDRRVAALALPRYIAGGISFGFAVVSLAAPDPACRGILALEPYLGWEFLQMGSVKRHALLALAKVVLGLNLHGRFLESPLFGLLATRKGDIPPAVIQTIQEQIDGETFFRTLQVVLGTRGPVPIRRLPHALLVNPQDSTIDAKRVISRFCAEVPDLLVVETAVPHFPRDLSSESFSRFLPQTDISRVREFCEMLA